MEKIFTPKVIDWVTSIIGLLIFLYEPLRAYFSEQPFDWGTFLPLLATSIVAYFTGKSGAGAMRLRQLDKKADGTAKRVSDDTIKNI